MKVYVASSWRNDVQPSVVDALRADGHDVYDFKNPAEGEHGFSWRELGTKPKEEWDGPFFANHILPHPMSKHGFDLDMNALRASSATVLVLPCGRSAHLELGFAVGLGQLTVVYIPPGRYDEPELMYRMCDYVETELVGVRRALSKWRPRPRFQADLDGYIVGSRYAGELPCNRITKEGPNGPCREYNHRACKTCGGCWRHGECECSPDVLGLRPWP